MSSWAQKNIQSAASPMMEEFIYFHDFINGFLVFILLFVVFIIYELCKNDISATRIAERNRLELIWTLLPVLVILIIGIPQTKLLYQIDDHQDAGLVVKVVGAQWYWEYETFVENNVNRSINVSQNLVYRQVKDDYLGAVRQFEVDDYLVLPVNVKIWFLVTRRDVIHSWAVPSVGIKVDAVPGRLNRARATWRQTGIFFGQCSEICGINHSHIPIGIAVVSVSDYFKYALGKQDVN